MIGKNDLPTVFFVNNPNVNIQCKPLPLIFDAGRRNKGRGMECHERQKYLPANGGEVWGSEFRAHEKKAGDFP